MEEVVVSATRQEEKIFTVPANVSVISEADIRQSTANNIPDLLKTQVGIQVVDITGNGRSFNVDLRGFGETAPLNTLVLVDGRKINQADLSGSDWTLIPIDRVKRIEIVRGGRGGVLYGDNAAGGVINIITKEGDALKAGVTVLGGSYDTWKGSAYMSGILKNVSYALSSSYLTSDGYRENSSTEAKDLGLKLSYYAGGQLKLNLSSGYHEDSTRLPGAIKTSEYAAGASRTDSLHPDDFADAEDYYIQIEPELFFLNESRIKINFSFRRRDSLSFSSGTWWSFTGDTEIETVSVSPQIVFNEEVFGFDNTLNIGSDLSDIVEDITNSSVFFGVPSQGIFNLKKENYGFYIHDVFNLRDNLALSGGYRYDRAKYAFQPSTPDRKTMSETLYNGGINYIYDQKKSSVYINYSRSFRYPVLDEIYNFVKNTIDTSLDPQTSDDYELGIRHYFTPRMYANINFFRIDTNDEIIYNSGAFANQNLDGKTRRDGLELLISKSYSKLTLSGSYTFTDATIRGGQFDGNDFPNIPEHKATFNALYSFENGFSIAINGIYMGKRPFISDFPNAFSDQKDYLVINTKFWYRWKNLTGFLNVNNITDESYSEFGGIDSTPEKGFYPSPKINFILGVTVDF